MMFPPGAIISNFPFIINGSRPTLFATGGQEYVKTTEILLNNQWVEDQRIPPLPEGVWLHCMVALGNKKVMVIGGNYNVWAEGSYYSTKTYVLNESLVWSEGPPLNIARHWHSCGMIRRTAGEDDKSAIVVGGLNKDGKLKSVEIFDEANNKWIAGPDLPIGIAAAGIVQDRTGVNFINIYKLIFCVNLSTFFVEHRI